MSINDLSRPLKYFIVRTVFKTHNHILNSGYVEIDVIVIEASVLIISCYTLSIEIVVRICKVLVERFRGAATRIVVS